MTEPVKVEQVDREAAASGYYAWLSGNRTIPEKMVAGAIDDHSMIQAFARHRLAERQRIYDELEKVTKEMDEAGSISAYKPTGWHNWNQVYRSIWKAMLAASPLAKEING